MVVPMTWQLAAGSDGNTILLLTDPIEDGAIWIPPNGIPAPIRGIRLQIAVNLAFLRGEGGAQQLSVAGPFAVTVKDGAHGLSLGAQQLLGDGVARGLAGKLDEVRFALATINQLNQLLPGQGDWTRLDYHHFSSLDRKGQTRHILAIFMSASAARTGSQELDQGLLGTDGTLGFAMSSEFFLDGWIRPQLAASVGVAASALNLHRAGEAYVNPAVKHYPDGSMTVAALSPDDDPSGWHADDIVGSDVVGLYSFQTVSLATISIGLVNYKPELAWLLASLKNDTMTVVLKGNCDMHLNIKALWRRTMTYRFVPDVNKGAINLTLIDDVMTMDTIYSIAGAYNIVDSSVKALIQAAIGDVSARLKAQLRVNLGHISTDLAAKAVSFGDENGVQSAQPPYHDGGAEDGIWFRNSGGV